MWLDFAAAAAAAAALVVLSSSAPYPSALSPRPLFLSVLSVA